MQNLSGYDEKKILVREKINTELKALPYIFTRYTTFLSDNRKADTTVYSYLSTLTSCFRTIYQDYYLSDESFYKKISSSDIEYYFDAKSNLGTKALQRHWSVLNSFFTFLVNENDISSNPMQTVRRPIDSNTNRKLNYLNRNELDRLLTTIKHNPTKFTSFRDEIIIKLAISTGLDIADMVNLNFDHIDFVNGTIHVISKKGDRLIPVGSSILTLLRKWSQFRSQYFKGSDTPALFISSLKHRLSVDAVGYMLRKYCEQANVPIITFKDLKSTMVYLLARENVSMESIMDFLGVSDYLIVVQAYDAAMKEYNTNILNAIDCLFATPVSKEQNLNGESEIQHNFSVEIKPPEYAQYTKGGEGFTIYGNITNLLEQPLKFKLKSCAIFINGMLRTSDYAYTGYQFDEEYIFPKTTRTFGKIWITDNFAEKQLHANDYLLLCLVEIDSHIEHHIKYVFKKSQLGDYWSEESWYEIDSH